MNVKHPALHSAEGSGGELRGTLGAFKLCAAQIDGRLRSELLQKNTVYTVFYRMLRKSVGRRMDGKPGFVAT